MIINVMNADIILQQIDSQGPGKDEHKKSHQSHVLLPEQWIAGLQSNENLKPKITSIRSSQLWFEKEEHFYSPRMKNNLRNKEKC